MEKHERYKDSCIDWIGEIPEHWEIKKIKYVTTINDESLPETTNEYYEIEYIEISNVKSGVGILKTEQYLFKNAPSRARRIVKDGDVIVSTVRTYLKSIAKIDIPSDNLIASTGFAVIRSRCIDSNFIGFLFYSEFLIGEIISLSTGVSYPAINPSQIGNIYIAIPLLKEQKTIARFLDHKTAEIDQLIAQKERLIELYEEEKTSIINQAVTKGINPDVKLKSSGIDWLGDIPEHWEVKKLKHLAEIIDCKNRTPEYFETGKYLVIRTSNVKNLKINLQNALYTNEENFMEWTKRGIPKVGGVLFTREAPAGEAALVPDNLPLCLGQRMMSLNPEEKILNSEFLLYFIYSSPVRHYISFCSSGSTVSHLRVPQVYEMPILHLPLKEQKAIANYIETECDRIDAKIAKTKRIIELQKEYRTALISEAVTGKIKVPQLS